MRMLRRSRRQSTTTAAASASAIQQQKIENIYKATSTLLANETKKLLG